MLTESKFPRSFVFNDRKFFYTGLRHHGIHTQESALVSNRRQGGLSSSIENIPTISPHLRCGRSYYALVMASCSQFFSHALCGIALIHQIHCVQWSKMVMGLRNNLLPTQVLWLVMALGVKKHLSGQFFHTRKPQVPCFQSVADKGAFIYNKNSQFFYVIICVIITLYRVWLIAARSARKFWTPFHRFYTRKHHF